VGDTHGVVQVTVKLLAVSVAGNMSSLKAAVIAVLVVTPGVGPGVVVAGEVTVTDGRVVSGAALVVNVQT
jgi:hypothetical protein